MRGIKVVKNSEITIIKGKGIPRSEIIYELIKLLKELKINVRVLFDDEFREALLLEAPFKSRSRQEIEKLKLFDHISGSRAQDPLIITFDHILNIIKEFEKENTVSFTSNEKLLILFSEALHEFAELEFEYSHCEKKACPMYRAYNLIKILGKKVIFRIEPCKQHSKLERYIESSQVQKLISPENL
jgi:hypothetical protein